MNGYGRGIIVLVVLGCMAAVCGCGSTGVVNRPIDRDRPLTTDFDPDDVRRTVEKMVDSMLEFPPLVEITADRRPVVDVTRIRNRTMQTIDTESITDSIRTRLIRTGKFRFKDRNTAGDDIEIMGEENELGLVNSAQAIKPGQQTATELYLYGAIIEMRTETGRVKDVYYKVTMNLKSLRSGEIIWTDEKEIRKERTRPLVGF